MGIESLPSHLRRRERQVYPGGIRVNWFMTGCAIRLTFKKFDTRLDPGTCRTSVPVCRGN